MGLFSAPEPASQKYASAEEYWKAESSLAQKNEKPKVIIKKVKRTSSKPAFNPQRSPARQNIQIISQEQAMLRELFSGERNFGTGRNLPRLNRALTSGGGLIKNGDFGETGRMFGVDRMERRGANV